MGTGNGNERSLLFLPTFISFCFFSFVLSFFFLLFSLFSCLGKGDGGGNGSKSVFDFLSSFLLFEREKWEDQLEKFEGNSLSFSFLFSVFFLSENPSSFQFWGGGMEREKDRGICLFRDKRNLQEQQGSKKPYISRVFGTQSEFLIPF